MDALEVKLTKPTHLKSKVWTYFGLRDANKKDQTTATCSICFADVKFKAGSTTNLATHLKRKHNDVDEGLPAKRKSKTLNDRASTSQSSGQMTISETLRRPKLSASRQTAITKAIAGFLAHDMRPYSTVADEGFQYMIGVLESRYTLPSRTFFSQTAIPQLYRDVKIRVQTQLSMADSIAITTDSWTSRATENYVAVTAHFINNDWEVENYTLEAKKFADAHTSENLSKCLAESVQVWKLERNGKPPAIATDNASNIVRAVKESFLNRHIGCFAHTLNLATQKGLKVPQMDRLLGRVRRVVSFFHKSTSAASSLVLMQAKLELPNHKLIMDVSTRWNSTFEMLSRYVEQQAAVFAAILNVKKQVKDLVTLSDDDVTNIELIIQVLKPLKTVTTMMCSQKHPTVSLIHPLKEMLLKHLEPAETDSKLVADVKKTISENLKPRYTEENTLKFLHQASALDPRFKTLPYLDDTSRLTVYHSLAVEAVQFSECHAQVVAVKQEPGVETVDPEDRALAAPLPQLEDGVDDDDDADDEPPVKVKREASETPAETSALVDLFGDVFVTKVEQAKCRSELVEDEIKEYKAEESLHLESDPLLWWRAREGKYRILSCFAKHCLGVPATSVASERVFSAAGDVVTAQRACLSSEHVNMLVFLSKNMKIPEDIN